MHALADQGQGGSSALWNGRQLHVGLRVEDSSTVPLCPQNEGLELRVLKVQGLGRRTDGHELVDMGQGRSSALGSGPHVHVELRVEQALCGALVAP